MDWTEETIVRLRGLWADGHSTAEIGRRLGVTKNAVVGKAHRLDLPARPSPIRRDGVASAQPRRAVPRRVAGPTLPPLGSLSSPASSPRADAPAEPAAASMTQAARPAPYRPEPFRSAPYRSEPLRAMPVSEVPLRPATAVPAGVARVQAPPRPYARSLTCCWPLGEPGTKSFRFCDDNAAAGKPYCAPHAAVAYVKVRDRREDAA